MKCIRWTIWLLGALLILTALDSKPDPPAINPSTNLCKILPHDCDCNTAPQRCDSLVAASPGPVSRLTADAFDPFRPAERMILTVHAADPSPPAPRA